MRQNVLKSEGTLLFFSNSFIFSHSVFHCLNCELDQLDPSYLLQTLVVFLYTNAKLGNRVILSLLKGGCLRISTAMINRAAWRGKVTLYHWGKSGQELIQESCSLVSSICFLVTTWTTTSLGVIPPTVGLPSHTNLQSRKYMIGQFVGDILRFALPK